MPTDNLTDAYLLACIDVALIIVTTVTEGGTNSANDFPVRDDDMSPEGERCATGDRTTAHGEDCNALKQEYLDRTYASAEDALRNATILLDRVSIELKQRVDSNA